MLQMSISKFLIYISHLKRCTHTCPHTILQIQIHSISMHTIECKVNICCTHNIKYSTHK